MTVAFVLSGGASLGSIQVGMAAALHERGINPELVIGTSVGAINGSWLAGGGGVDELADGWRSLRRNQLFPLRPLTGWRGFAGRAAHFVPDTGLRRLLTRHLRFRNLEEAAVPFLVLTADGRLLMDGGVVNNTPITTAIDAGATEVWVLSTGYSCRLPAPPSSALAMAAHSIALLVQQRLVLESRARDYAVPVHFIPPPCPISVRPVDFSQTDELIDRAAAGTRQWLGNGCPNAMPLLMPHDHDEAGLPHMR